MTEASRNEVRPAYYDLARTLSRVLALGANEARCVVGIGGESGSGKSITALCLADTLSSQGVPTCVLHQDDYFFRPPRTNHDWRVGDLARVGPQEVDLGKLASHIAAFRAGAASVRVPVVDYPDNRFLERTMNFAPFRVLVVEGTYVLAMEDVNARVFLEATWEDTRERRRVRNRDEHSPVIDQILAIEHHLIAPQRKIADVCIDRDFRIVGAPNGRG